MLSFIAVFGRCRRIFRFVRRRVKVIVMSYLWYWRTFVLVLVALIVQCFAAPSSREHVCIHGSRKDELITGVRINEGSRTKRMARRPIRFSTYPDITITSLSVSYLTITNNVVILLLMNNILQYFSLPRSKREIIMDKVMPSLLNYLSRILSVTPLTQPILLNPQCSSEGYYQTQSERQCANYCLSFTTCGSVQVPLSHLKRCVECRNGPVAMCRSGRPAEDGGGVANTDFMLYISANQSECPQTSGTTVLAFASACQLESVQDRPIAGYINFCPTALNDATEDHIYDVAKHEIFHALAFSSQLFPYWRDRDGTPRTPRDQHGQPPIDQSSNTPVASRSTMRRVTYNSWITARGPAQHTVTVLATEAILREGRAHFAYPQLKGVELENQGGEGTTLQHWEKRLLGNEAMTGVFTFDPVFSRLSLAVMEDSGWYTVDYSSASPLLWGRGKGRSFVEEGCGKLVECDHNEFCGDGERRGRLACTLGRGAVAQCNRVTFTSQLPTDYQYFRDSPRDGGELQLTDYCPIYRAFTYHSGKGTNCSDPANQQEAVSNVRSEKYGPRSRCIEQGREWKTVFGHFIYSSSQFGGGCYEYECSKEGVTIYVRDVAFKCSCEGEEHIIDIGDDSECVSGSILCPSCSSLCYDHPNTCPSPEPACHGKVVEEGEGNCLHRVRETSSGTITTPLTNLLLISITTLYLFL